MKTCPECGTQVSDDMSFCPKCGHPINVEFKVAQNKSENRNNGHKSYANWLLYFFLVLIAIGFFCLYIKVRSVGSEAEIAITEIVNHLKSDPDPRQFYGRYTIVDRDGNKFSLLLEQAGTAILANYGENRGEAYTWDVKQWNNITYVKLYGTSKLINNLYLYGSRIYDNEFDLRRENKNQYVYVVEKKE